MQGAERNALQILSSSKGSANRKSRQSRLDVNDGDNEFSATALQSKSLLEPLTAAEQLARTPELEQAPSKGIPDIKT